MKIKKICKWCGKEFATQDKLRKYCNKSCTMNAREEAILKKSQLCWRCAYAIGGCSWSDRLKPVQGWKAKLTTRKEHDGYVFKSYRILSCPQFKSDLEIRR